MNLNYQLPKEYNMTKKEQEEMSEEINTKVKAMSKNFLKGLFFFITVPISLYKKLNHRRKKQCQQ